MNSSAVADNFAAREPPALMRAISRQVGERHIVSIILTSSSDAKSTPKSRSRIRMRLIAASGREPGASSEPVASLRVRAARVQRVVNDATNGVG